MAPPRPPRNRRCTHGLTSHRPLAFDRRRTSLAVATAGHSLTAASVRQAYRGGALLRLLHARWRKMASDEAAGALYSFLLERTAAPFFETLTVPRRGSST